MPSGIITGAIRTVESIERDYNQFKNNRPAWKRNHAGSDGTEESRYISEMEARRKLIDERKEQIDAEIEEMKAKGFRPIFGAVGNIIGWGREESLDEIYKDNPYYRPMNNESFDDIYKDNPYYKPSGRAES